MPTPSAPWLNDGQITTVWAEGGTPPPSSCDVFYRSRRFADYFFKECPTGQVGSGVYFIVPAGRFWSMISQEHADEQAINYLETAGQEAAQLNGVCKLGDFTEIFTSLQTALHWDWIGDKGAPSFPFHGHGIEIAGNGYTLLPLLNFTFFKGSNGTALGARPDTKLAFTVEPTHGMIHVNLASFSASLESLLAGGWVTTGDLAQNLIPFQTYGGFLLGDFGSEEIWGDVNGEGAWELGGFLGVVETIESFATPFSPHPTDPTKPGHFNGYIIAYKDVVGIYKWSDVTETYETITTIDFDLRDRTTYIGYGIRYDRGRWAAEFYINGAWQYSIFDDSITSFTMMRYQRGVLSMDYWMGDMLIGSMSPFTNRVPPALKVLSFEPAEVYTAYPEARPVNKPELIPQGTATDTLDAIEGPGSIRTAQPVKSLGFSATASGEIGYRRPVAEWGVRWDPNTWTDPKIATQTRLFGCCPYMLHRWTKEYVAPFPYGMNREYEGVLSSDDILYFFNCSDTEFPAIIPSLSIFNEEPYSDVANLKQLPANCKPSGYDRALEAQDLLEPYTWETMSHQTFPFTGTLYTKDYVASRWIYFRLEPQSADDVSAPTVFNFHVPHLKMFSGTRGIRTRKKIAAPIYDLQTCPYPNCQTPDTQARILQTSFGTFTGSDADRNISVVQTCDTLFPGLFSVEQGEWNWTVTVKDYDDGGNRKIRVTVSMVSAKLMDDFLMNSSQLQPLPNAAGFVRFLAWRTDWELPVWDQVVALTNYTLNVPPLPPSGGPGMPPEATLIYEFDGTGNPEPSFADNTGLFYFHLIGGL